MLQEGSRYFLEFWWISTTNLTARIKTVNQQVYLWVLYIEGENKIIVYYQISARVSSRIQAALQFVQRSHFQQLVEGIAGPLYLGCFAKGLREGSPCPRHSYQSLNPASWAVHSAMAFFGPFQACQSPRFQGWPHLRRVHLPSRRDLPLHGQLDKETRATKVLTGSPFRRCALLINCTICCAGVYNTVPTEHVGKKEPSAPWLTVYQPKAKSNSPLHVFD